MNYEFLLTFTFILNNNFKINIIPYSADSPYYIKSYSCRPKQIPIFKHWSTRCWPFSWPIVPSRSTRSRWTCWYASSRAIISCTGAQSAPRRPRARTTCCGCCRASRSASRRIRWGDLDHVARVTIGTLSDGKSTRAAEREGRADRAQLPRHAAEGERRPTVRRVPRWFLPQLLAADPEKEEG